MRILPPHFNRLIVNADAKRAASVERSAVNHEAIADAMTRAVTGAVIVVKRDKSAAESIGQSVARSVVKRPAKSAVENIVRNVAARPAKSAAENIVRNVAAKPVERRAGSIVKSVGANIAVRYAAKRVVTRVGMLAAITAAISAIHGAITTGIMIVTMTGRGITITHKPAAVMARIS